MKKSVRSFSGSIYPLPVIEEAVTAYAGIAEISVSAAAGKLVCTFLETDTPVSLVVNEFGNYLIEILNNNYDLL